MPFIIASSFAMILKNQQNFEWTRFLDDEILSFLNNPGIIIRSQVFIVVFRFSEKCSIESFIEVRRSSEWILIFRWMSWYSMEEKQETQAKSKHLKAGFNEVLNSSEERLRERPSIDRRMKKFEEIASFYTEIWGISKSEKQYANFGNDKQIIRG